VKKYMTATYNYLGYGVTDSNGKAKLEYDAQGNPLTHSYTGTGAGEVDIVASLDSEITDGSLVSETYSVLDCSYFDSGTTGTVYSGWVNKNATLSSQGGTDGTLFSNSGSSFGTFYANKNGTSGSSWSDLYDYSAPLKIEFDVVSVTGSDKTCVICNDGTNPFQVYFNTYGVSANSHVIITVEATRYKIKVDDTESNWINHSLATDFGVAFRLNDSTASMKFKNFMVYPI
jgi:hypothetical protein